MTIRLACALAAAMGLALPLTSTAQPATAVPGETAAPAAANPLFVPSTLPLQYPPFDRIEDAHFGPAFERGMAEHRKEIEAIANNSEAATFDNTIVALERSGDLLTRTLSVFFNLTSADTNDTLEALQAELAPKLSAHRDAIVLNGMLFERVRSLHAKRDTLGLDVEGKHLLERTHTDFVRAGAQLSEADKEKLKALNAELASLSTAFGQNVLNEVNASAIEIEDKAVLAGLPESAMAAAAARAKDAEGDAPYVIALQNTTGQPPLASLDNRELRKRIHEVSVSRGSRGGEFDNRANVVKQAKLRAERAKLLGYPTHAAYQLEDATAKTTDAVNAMLARLAPPATANARAEAADLQKIIDADKGGFKLAAWDWAYYTEKLRQQRYDFDEAQLKPYFEMNRVLEDGVFHAATELYGITFKERHDLPVYHPDVRVFDVFDADGSQLAIFLADFYARPSKRGGAWMNEYVGQSGLLKTKPVVANHLNVPKPPEGKPTLLTFDEVTTMFHEFGHALHGMFSNVTYPRFSGTSVPRDFVEYPSQVNEMWAVWPSGLANYAKHHETGEAMPKALLDKVLATQKFNQGFTTTEYLAASLLDQAWHQITPEQAPTADKALAFEAAALKKAGVAMEEVPPRYRSTYFSHAFSGGYSAGYYSYIWSEVLDADTVKWFEEKGGLKRALGDHFRKTLLSRGGSVDAMQLFRDFRGRDADINALLERRGLATPEHVGG